MDDPWEDVETHDKFDQLRAQLAELRQAILSAHPSGDDENADPLEVVHTLGQEWLEQIHKRPESPIKFMDGDQERSIVWDDGDESVGVHSGYCLEDDEAPSYSDIHDCLMASIERITEHEETIEELKVKIAEIAEGNHADLCQSHEEQQVVIKRLRGVMGDALSDCFDGKSGDAAAKLARALGWTYDGLNWHEQHSAAPKKNVDE